MKQVLLFNENTSPARTNTQQLKVIMNLPVRLISDNKVMDVIPIPEQYIAPDKRRVIKFANVYADFSNYTPDELIDFFQNSKHGDFLTPKQVAFMYDVTSRTISTWAAKGLLKRYMLSFSLILYKRDELPTIEALYGEN